MSKFFSQKYASLKAYVPGEQPKDMQYIKLNTNESPFPPSQSVRDAVIEQAFLCNLYSDPACTDLSRENARKAGVETMIEFDTRDALSLPLDRMRGVLFANPPYGERLLDRETAQQIYRGLVP